ncbi:uncharacterized protein CDAR_467121 [Caerostris darwini]|uniref:Uncharacterized protein n=1 Tax=Caerostris darwini TaxID=1538125 RepID=A0AAV4T8V6_9ARAC|nr:uncharacterized protein CDAR_467121 [Caerostris darwini]
MEPFSTSVLQVLIEVFATTTKICTRGRSTRAHALGFVTDLHNRYEPPPEFPLASPYSGIVHHLSGPNRYALTQIHPRTSGSVDDAPKLSPAFTFITRRGLTPEHSHRLLGPCFKTGRR